jgi:hypothetical protein
MICVWQFTDEHGHFCATCGRYWKVSSPADRSRRTCCKNEKQSPRDCIHHGEKIGERLCETCEGRVQVFIFECAQFGKCTDKKKFADLAGCTGCGRFTSSAAVCSPSARE